MLGDCYDPQPKAWIHKEGLLPLRLCHLWTQDELGNLLDGPLRLYYKSYAGTQKL